MRVRLRWDEVKFEIRSDNVKDTKYVPLCILYPTFTGVIDSVPTTTPKSSTMTTTRIRPPISKEASAAASL